MKGAISNKYPIISAQGHQPTIDMDELQVRKYQSDHENIEHVFLNFVAALAGSLQVQMMKRRTKDRDDKPVIRNFERAFGEYEEEDCRRQAGYGRNNNSAKSFRITHIRMCKL